VLLSQAVVERLASTNVPLLKRLADVKARGREERIAVYTFVVTGTEPS
jgi:hypothetical protein